MPHTTPARVVRKLSGTVLLLPSLLLAASCSGKISGADAAAKSPQDPPTQDILLKVDNGLVLAESGYFTEALNAASPYASRGYATSQLWSGYSTCTERASLRIVKRRRNG
jgi:hypothetical protein